MRLKRKHRIPAKQPEPKPVPKPHIKNFPKPISDIAKSAGIRTKFLELYGKDKAKISLDILKSFKKGKRGKYVIVTSITPTPFGEGKTVTAIGLAMAFKKMKKKAIPVITQPSLGDVFDTKGTATGGGYARVFPMVDANLHLTGDRHAVEAAHNLCATYLDNSIFYNNPLNIAAGSISWKRVLDTHDRFLRNINIGLGGKSDGITRKTGFNPTDTSEVMAILETSENINDLKERLKRIVLAFTPKEQAVKCEDIKASGAMAILLKDAIRPNLLQTEENTPCLMHAGSSVTTSLGASSIIADRIALGLSDYAIVEIGAGTDLGAEKFFDIKCRQSSLKPDAAIIVCSTRGLKMHSGDFEIPQAKIPKEMMRENISAIERGLSNLDKHVENMQVFGVPVVVCLNRFSSDTDKEIAVIKRRAMDLGAQGFAVSDVWAHGGPGGIELAQAVIEVCKAKNNFRFLYPPDLPIKDKIRRIAKTLYGAKEVVLSDAANKMVSVCKKLKLDNLPVCMIKTPLSFSLNSSRKGRPHGFKLVVEDIEICNGAGYIAVFCENVKAMPDLPQVPRGTKMDMEPDGKIIGLV